MSKRKINYPVTRKPSGKKVCSICDEEFAARGLKAHIRLVHQVKLTEVTQVSTKITSYRNQGTSELTQVKLLATKPADKPCDLNKTAVIYHKGELLVPVDTIRLEKMRKWRDAHNDAVLKKGWHTAYYPEIR